MIMKIDNILLDKLTAQAQASPRLRMNLDLRNSSADSSQRMLNAIEPGSVVPIHRHQKTSETVVVLRGRVVEEFYDDARVLVESFVLGDCHVADAPRNDVPMACALNIPAGQWHTLRALESGTVILEMKDGPYEPIGAENVMER
jgi:cupin fold WbuC family metalloprotein